MTTPALLVVLALAAAAEAPTLRLELAAAEKAAEQADPGLRALEAESEAARRRADARRADLWPRLTVEASYRYVTEVPELSLTPGRSLSFGDNENYSLGPSLSWTAWDKGARRQAWRSARSLARSQEEQAKAGRLELRSRARAAYAQAQLALANVRLLADSLKVAQSQHRDIEARHRAGASSRADALSAHQEVLQRRRQFRQARADLAVALRELLALTGTDPGADLRLPLAADMSRPLPKDVEEASVLVALDAPEESLRRLALAVGLEPDAAHPSLSALAEQAESSRRAAAGARAGLWPKLTFSARTSLDYPNGPVLERFNQNAVGAAFSVPLFEGGRARREAAGLETQAEAARSRLEGRRRDMDRDWLKAKDQLAGLEAQQTINRQAVAEAGELARLVYDSYRAGQSTYVEVQSANLRELEARLQAAATDIRMLLQLAALAALSEKENP